MKNISKIFKLTTSIVMVSLIMFSNLVSVKAATAVDSMVIDNYEAGYAKNPLGINRSFQVKQATDGKYVYCMAYNLLVPKNTKYTNKGITNDSGVAYIVSQGLNDKTLNEYFVTQVALWIYLLDNNLMQDSSAGSIKAYRSTVYSSSYDNNELAKQIRDRVAKAKSAPSKETANLSIDKSATFTLENGVYTSSVIKVNTSASDYEVKLENAPEGSSYKKVENGFVVTVPASDIESGVSFKATVTASDELTDVYVYKAASSSYQPVATPYTKQVNMSDEINLSIESSVVSFIKRDKETNEILEGATLVLTDEEGNVIEEWTTTTEAHLIYNLKNGKYILSEKEAPEGYVLNEEKITFEITDDNSSQTITFYNEKEVPETPEEVINVPVESTGMSKGMMGAVIGIMAIASGIIVIYRKTKLNK